MSGVRQSFTKPFGHLEADIKRVGASVTWGIMITNLETEKRKGIYTGVCDRKFATDLRRMASQIDSMLDEIDAVEKFSPKKANA